MTDMDAFQTSAPFCVTPEHSYAEFLAAVARRDFDAVLARLCARQADRLRACRARRGFEHHFEMWCRKYPRGLQVAACYVDGDTAILETSAESGALAGRVTMVLDDDAWYVLNESWDACAVGIAA